MSKQQSKFGPRYDEAFKRQAVGWIETRAALDSGPQPRAGRFGMELVALVQAVGQGGGGPPAAAATLAAEVARLRREVEVVSRRGDILKKALAILGQEPWNATK
jgi:transposase-like protein